MLALEQLRANGDIILAKYKAETQWSIESFKAALVAGRDALRAITLLNGGGAVAMLAFVGSIAPATDARSLGMPLLLFVVGAFLAVTASGITYVAQNCSAAGLTWRFRSHGKEGAELAQAKRRERRWKLAFWIVNSIGILTAALALACFVAGVCHGYHAFEELYIVKGCA